MQEVPIQHLHVPLEAVVSALYRSNKAYCLKSDVGNKYVCMVKTVRISLVRKWLFLLQKITGKHKMFSAMIWVSRVVFSAKGIFPQEPGKTPDKQTIY